MNKEILELVSALKSMPGIDYKLTIEIVSNTNTSNSGNTTVELSGNEKEKAESELTVLSDDELRGRFPKHGSVLSQVHFLIESAGKPLTVREMKEMLNTIGFTILNLDQRCSQFAKDEHRLRLIKDFAGGRTGRYDLPD